MGKLRRRLHRWLFANYWVLTFRPHGPRAPYSILRFDCLVRALDTAARLAEGNPSADVCVVNGRAPLLYQTYRHTECKQPKEHR